MRKQEKLKKQDVSLFEERVQHKACTCFEAITESSVHVSRELCSLSSSDKLDYYVIMLDTLYNNDIPCKFIVLIN